MIIQPAPPSPLYSSSATKACTGRIYHWSQRLFCHFLNGKASWHRKCRFAVKINFNPFPPISSDAGQSPSVQCSSWFSRREGLNQGCFQWTLSFEQTFPAGLLGPYNWDGIVLLNVLDNLHHQQQQLLLHHHQLDNLNIAKLLRLPNFFHIKLALHAVVLPGRQLSVPNLYLKDKQARQLPAEWVFYLQWNSILWNNPVNPVNPVNPMKLLKLIPPGWTSMFSQIWGPDSEAIISKVRIDFGALWSLLYQSYSYSPTCVPNSDILEVTFHPRWSQWTGFGGTPGGAWQSRPIVCNRLSSPARYIFLMKGDNIAELCL